ncbi:MAG: zf-HC2 domain-containing protein [Syntrophomonadaceae bacterium]|nr:zf-HC2 domain-containing protein [Syntrophomonadaceae bacterium]MDD3022968.1 zf-HC2 domain-containing protein [Syntrophomonadaceae bacterium]
MNCQDIEKYCLDYCDNNLSPELNELFEQHLQQCNNCKNLIDLTMLENSILLDPIDIPPLKPDFNARLLDRIDSNGQLYPNSALSNNGGLSKYLFNRPFIKRSWALIAAVLLLALVLPSILNQNINNSQHLAQNDIDNNSQPQYNKTKLERTTTEKSNLSLDQEIVQLKSESKTPSSTEDLADSGKQAKITNQEIALDTLAPQELVAGNGSSREANKTKISSRLLVNDEASEPYPENLPPNYQLVANNQSNGQFIYLYRETATNEELNIIITPLKLEDIKPAAMSEAVAETSNTNAIVSYQMANENELSTAADKALLNSSSKDITTENVSYSLTISGNLPQEKIDSIASLITLTEK